MPPFGGTAVPYGSLCRIAWPGPVAGRVQRSQIARFYASQLSRFKQKCVSFGLFGGHGA